MGFFFKNHLIKCNCRAKNKYGESRKRENCKKVSYIRLIKLNITVYPGYSQVKFFAKCGQRV